MTVPVDVIELAAERLAVERLVEGLATVHGAGVDGGGVDVECAIWKYSVVVGSVCWFRFGGVLRVLLGSRG